MKWIKVKIDYFSDELNQTKENLINILSEIGIKQIEVSDFFTDNSLDYNVNFKKESDVWSITGYIIDNRFANLKLNIIYETPEKIVKFLNDKNYLKIATALHEDSVSYEKIELRENNAFIFGHEGGGVSEYLIENSDIKAIIPIYGNIESLNVSVATGIFLYKMREKLENL